MIDHKRILRWQIAGFIELVLIGALLHFTYEWSGYSPIVGLFSSVNESVWEHMKLGFTSVVVFGAVEYAFVGKGNGRYFLAKALGILTLQVFVIAFFYTYTAFTGDDILILDIASFVVGSALCQLVAYRVLVGERPWRLANPVGVGVLVIHAALLVVFTFATPEVGLFRDSNSGEYGTEWRVDPEHRDHDH